jgi:hypothetical protein
LSLPVFTLSREGDLLLMGNAKNLRAKIRVGDSNREQCMSFSRTVTMLALAREALERFDNDAAAAQAYLSERLVSDGELREALVKAAIEYERLEMLEAPS